MTTVTLATGQSADSASPEWREECLARQRHVEALQHLPSRDQRAQYIATVERIEGSEAAKRLKEAFLKAWEARQA